MKINEKKLDEIMLELGHRDNVKGTEYLRIGAALYDREKAMVKELYPAIAKAANTTPSRAERAMRHSIASAWGRGNMEAQRKYFGYSVNPNSGVPTVSEYLARIARVCGEN
jgi:two-component system response regulator (stage 0 sporulation protein A)